MMTAIAVAAALLAAPVPPRADPLTSEIGALDARVFDAYNRCDLRTFSGYFDPKVAFYHDTGGATFERDAMVGGVRKYICGKVKRELIPATFRVYPIKEMARSRKANTASATWRQDGAKASPSSSWSGRSRMASGGSQSSSVMGTVPRCLRSSEAPVTDSSSAAFDWQRPTRWLAPPY